MEKRGEKITSLPWAHLHLPPFPQVAIRVLQLANKENAQLQELCDLISADPAFASEVLAVANSILYAPRFPATSILQAVTVLGANTLQGMCITVGVRAYLGKAMHYPAIHNLWRHSLACAIVAERLASVGLIDKEEAYTAGILHDIGRMALAVVLPSDYAALLEAKCGPAGSILEGERELFGWDHCEMGLQLAGDWKLPSELEPVVSGHHEPRRTDGAWDVAELIKVSCRIADTAGFPAFHGCVKTPYTELLGLLPARERRLFYPELAPLAFEVAQSIRAIERA